MCYHLNNYEYVSGKVVIAMKSWKKRYISIILVFFVAFGILPGLMGGSIAFAGTESKDELLGVKIGAGNIGILGKTAASYGTLQATLDGTTLTISGKGAIPDNAFPKNHTDSKAKFKIDVSQVKKIVINKGITEIGPYAFTGCTKATSVTLSEGITLIRDGAFRECASITSVSLPKSITHVQAGAFSSKTSVRPQNSKLVKYTAKDEKTGAQYVGYEIQDTLKFTALWDYSKGFKLLESINAKRKAKSLDPLTMDVSLTECAMERAMEIVVLYDHIRPTGERCFTISGQVKGEDALVGGTDPATIIKALDSEAQKNKTTPYYLLKNLPDEAKSKSVGVGCIQHNGTYYWIICYGTQVLQKFSGTPITTTKTQAIKFPYGTNVITRNGVKHTHAFKINTGNLKLAVRNINGTINPDKITASLKLGGVTFIRNSGKWSSDNASVARVSSAGEITPVNPGTTQIRAGSVYTNRAAITVTTYKMSRYYGSSRYETAYEIGKAYKKIKTAAKFDSIIVACGTDFPDALAGSYLSKAINAPIIVWRAKEHTGFQKYIKEYVKPGGKIYLLGGTAAVDNYVKTGLGNYKFKRIEGRTRFETNTEVLKSAGFKSGEILVCDGLSFQNALIASATGKPLLLVMGEALRPAQKEVLSKASNLKVTIIGGTTGASAVSSKIETELRGYTSNVTRITGSTPDEVSAKVAKKYFAVPKEAILTVDYNFPDGLCGGPLALAKNCPIFLIGDKESAHKHTLNYFKDNKITNVTALGGDTLITDQVCEKMTT